MPDATRLEPGFDAAHATGVYVHVPFCVRRCPYCNFDIAVRRNIPHEAYRNALLTELDARAPAVLAATPHAPLRTIYFGGGTPALWRADCLLEVLDRLRTLTHAPDDLLEVTVEANPEDLAGETLEALRAGGVTRLSLGVQSFEPATLEFLGRAHSPDTARAVVAAAHALGFSTSVDLIFGAAAQDAVRLEADLAELTALGIEHVSAYGLTVERRTAFGRRAARGEALTVDEDAMAERFEQVALTLADHGFVRYEVSNLARPPAFSRHNTLYWLGGCYLGLGMGAHSLLRHPDGSATRRAAGPDLRAYLADPTGHVAFEESLTADVHLAERLFTALRTRFWIDLDALAVDHPAAQMARYAPALERIVALGLAERDGARIRATERGLALHDSAAAMIVEQMP